MQHRHMETNHKYKYTIQNIAITQNETPLVNFCNQKVQQLILVPVINLQFTETKIRIM